MSSIVLLLLLLLLLLHGSGSEWNTTLEYSLSWSLSAYHSPYIRSQREGEEDSAYHLTTWITNSIFPLIMQHEPPTTHNNLPYYNNNYNKPPPIRLTNCTHPLTDWADPRVGTIPWSLWCAGNESQREKNTSISPSPRPPTTPPFLGSLTTVLSFSTCFGVGLLPVAAFFRRFIERVGGL